MFTKNWESVDLTNTNRKESAVNNEISALIWKRYKHFSLWSFSQTRSWMKHNLHFPPFLKWTVKILFDCSLLPKSTTMSESVIVPVPEKENADSPTTMVSFPHFWRFTFLLCVIIKFISRKKWQLHCLNILIIFQKRKRDTPFKDIKNTVNSQEDSRLKGTPSKRSSRSFFHFTPSKEEKDDKKSSTEGGEKKRRDVCVAIVFFSSASERVILTLTLLSVLFECQRNGERYCQVFW